MALAKLPIDDVLGEVIAGVRARGALVLGAQTGAGKTTRVPPALLDAGLSGTKRIVVLEPRRLAARAAARRIASERGVKLGEEVGYHVRFDRVAGPRTRLLIVTEGILTRMLQDDPFLEETGLVVFDEFHERSLDADLALALVQRVRRDARPDLRVVVMSATLDAAPIAAFLGDAAIVSSAGRLFPVEVEHAPMRRDDRLEPAVAAAVRSLLPRTDGDVLVFLPGLGEIRRCGEELAPVAAARDLEVLELHGDLAPELQDRALEPGERRRVILATNVAETSVTLPGVTAVVDGGLVRRMVLDPASGLDRLELGRVSKASAEQRRGRAGRVAPGICVRLWSALDQRSLDDEETPEIRRVDLAGFALQLLAFGERDPAALPFLEAPDRGRLARALELLERLGATRGGAITQLGQAMARLPVHPRLARLLEEGARLCVARRAALAAALLSERDPFLRAERRGPRRPAAHESESDVVDRVAALEAFAARGTTSSEVGELHRSRAEQLLRAAEQLVRLVDESFPRAERRARATALARSPDASDESDDALMRALLAAYPDRVARRREPESPRARMVGGRGVKLAVESAVRRAELFLAIDVDGGGSGAGGPGAPGSDDALVRIASAVRREWLDEVLLTTEDVVRFDREREAVVARRVTRLDDLVLEEKTSAAPEPEAAARVLAEAAAQDVVRALGLAEDEVARFLVRVARLREWMPELALPAFDATTWREWLPELCAGARSFAELRRLPLVELLRGRLGHRLAQAVEQHAPDRLTVPSGSSIRLDYPREGAPSLAVRMQELFGLADTPRIAGGRVAVVLHLLAPNHRPQQVTQDLRSFWNGVYPKIRGELRARYPRHAWPEDPWNAPPIRGPVKRRRG
jgi:ATP-dependent helicase HrpB